MARKITNSGGKIKPRSNKFSIASGRPETIFRKFFRFCERAFLRISIIVDAYLLRAPESGHSLSPLAAGCFAFLVNPKGPGGFF